jgi:hypothetical protein
VNKLWRYLKAALFVKQRIPLLGPLPVNLLALLPFLALGFGHPGFWLLGLAGEVGFLWAMTTNRRFRKAVDAQLAHSSGQEQSRTKEDVVAQLKSPQAERYAGILEKRTHIESIVGTDLATETLEWDHLEGIRTLETVYLKLLIARQHLSSPTAAEDVREIVERIAGLKAQSAQARSESLRDSLLATVTLLEKRLAVLARRRESLEEVDSDLNRIEVQFQLAIDSAALHNDPSEARLDLDLASRMMISPAYTELGDAVYLTDQSSMERD